MLIGTHGHHDHIQSCFQVMDYFKIPLMIHPNDFHRLKMENVLYIKEPDIIDIGPQRLHVVDTPGHTSGGIMLVDYENKLIIAGDTIIRGTIPRQLVNFDELIESIRKILHFPNITDDFVIYPGHGGKTTIGDEKKNNKYRKYFL